MQLKSMTRQFTETKQPPVTGDARSVGGEIVRRICQLPTPKRDGMNC